MSKNLASDIRTYAAMVDSLPDYDESLEVTNVLVWREAIQDEVRDGASLESDDRVLLAQADVTLATLGPLLVRRFPEVFEVSANIPRDLWWWHLGNEPKVREEAGATEHRGA